MKIKNLIITITFLTLLNNAVIGTPAKTEGNKEIQPSPAYWNIYLEEDGIYRITYDDLTTIQVDLKQVDISQALVLFQGKPVNLHASKEAGTWTKDDFIEFYGEKPKDIRGERDPYTRQNVYQLTFTQTKPAFYSLNDQSKDVYLSSKDFEPSSPYFTDNILRYSDSQYRYFTDAGALYPRIWYWELFRAPQISHHEGTLDLPGLYQKDTSIPIKLKVLLQGQTYPPVTPNHHAKFSVNGNPIGETYWTDKSNHLQEHIFDTTFSLNLLTLSRNTLTIEAPGDIKSNPPMDMFLLAEYTITYPREFRALNESLVFPCRGESTTNFEINGYKSPKITILDLSNCKVIQPEILQKPEEKGTYTCRFSYYSPESTRLVAYSDLAVKKPVIIKAIYKTDLKTFHGADYVILTYDDFASELTPLIQLRQKQGHTVKIVKISDVYNEFNYGRFSPEAIRKFTTHAWNHWNPRIKYLFIIGDANWDYRNIHSKVPNWVPTMIYWSSASNIVSDNYFAMMDTTSNKPSFAVGRLTARTQDDVRNYIKKVLAYETGTTDNSWASRALLASGYEYMFTSDMNAFAKEISNSYQVITCYAHPLPEYSVGFADETARAILQKAIQDGVGIMAFQGHGSHGFWADRRLLTTEDILRMKNKDKYPFVLSMTCFTGRFEYSTETTIDSSGVSEILVKQPGGGAIAALGATGRSSVSSNSRMLRTIIQALLQKKVKTIGEAVLLSKQEMSEAEKDMMHTYILFGDPAVQFKGPADSATNSH
jgi:hypothetical protein